MADTTITANGTNNLYALIGINNSYNIAHSTYWGESTTGSANVGQFYLSATSKYYVYRLTPLFDLSELSGVTVTAAIFKFTGGGDQSDTDVNLHLYAFTESSLAGNTTCFNGYGSTSFGSINTSDYSSDADGMTITLNASGITYINNKIGGDCVLMMRSTPDVNSSTPTGRADIAIYSGEYSTSAKRPHLYLEYEEAAAWTPKIMMVMSPLVDGLLEWIRKPITANRYLQM